MDAEWLRERVGKELAVGLADVVLVRPPDPVEYLGKWILKRLDDQHVENERRSHQDFIQSRQIALQKEKQRVQAQSEKEAKAKQGAAASYEAAFYDALRSSLDNELFQEVLITFRTALGVANAYLLQNDSIPDDLLRFVASTPENAAILKGQVLHRKEGMTFSAVDPIVQQPSPRTTKNSDEASLGGKETKEEDGDGDGDGDRDEDGGEDKEKKKKKKEEVRTVFGRTVFIPDVFKERRMKFFHIPKPGSYVALPIRTSDGEVVLVLAADTIGQVDHLTPERIALAERLAEAFAHEFERREAERKERLQLKAEGALASFKEREYQEETPPRDCETPQAFHLTQARRHLVSIHMMLEALDADLVDELRQLKAPSKPVFKALRAVLLLLGHASSSVATWSACRQLISRDLFDSIRDWDPATATLTKAALRQATKMHQGAAEAWRSSVLAHMLYKWTATAVVARKKSSMATSEEKRIARDKIISAREKAIAEGVDEDDLPPLPDEEEEETDAELEGEGIEDGEEEEEEEEGEDEDDDAEEEEA